MTGLDEFFNSVKDQAKKMLLQDGYHSNIAIALTRSGKTFVTLISYKNDRAKLGAFKKFRKILKEKDCIATIQVNEVWAKRLERDEVKRLDDFLPIRKLESKQEGLMITLNSFEKKKMVVIDFDRSEDGKIILGEEQEFKDFKDNLVGKFFEMRRYL